MHPFYKTYISIKWLGEWAVYHSRGMFFLGKDQEDEKCEKSPRILAR